MEPISQNGQNATGSVRSTDDFKLAVIRILKLPGGLDLLLQNPDLMDSIPLRDLFRHISEEDIERVLDSPAGDYVVGERREALITLLTERKDEIDARLEALRNEASQRGRNSDDTQVP